MAKKLQLRRGTTTQHGSFTGAEGEVTIDTTKDTAVVHDGAQAGGRPLLREDMSNLPAGTIDNADVNSSAAIAGTKISPNFGSQDIETTGNIDLSDSTGSGNNRIKLGTGDDLEIYHLGSNNNSYITETGSGNLVIGGDMVNLTNAATTESYIRCAGNGAVELYYDNAKKLETTSAGVTVTGNVVAGDLKLPDNGALRLGGDASALGDLRIYHDGSHSYIKDAGAGDIFIRHGNDDAIRCVTDGGVELYHDNVKKFNTDSGGAQVFGVLRFDDGSSSTNQINFGNSADLQIYHDGNSKIQNTNNSCDFRLISNSIELKSQSGDEYFQKCTVDGAVELYHNNLKKCETFGNGIIVYGPEGGGGLVNLYADEGDDNADKWRIHANPNGSFYLQNYTSGSWENNLAATGNGQTELFYDNVKRFETTSLGATVFAELNIAGSSSGTSSGTAKFKGYRTVADNGVLGELQFINQRDNDVQAKIEVVADGDTNAYFDVFASTANNRTFRIYDGSVAFPDTNKLALGNGNDLQIYHESGYNIINTNTAGNLDIKNGSEYIARFAPNGNNELFYDNSKKFETTSAGVTVSGSLTVSQGNYSYITMGDNDHGARDIHNNNNQIGFLQQSGAWGAYCDDNGNWTASGNVTAYSDSRLKRDISTINDALGIVGKLRGVSYKWLRDGSDGIGVIAQEVEEVIPSVVVTNKVEGLDGIEEVKSVDYGKIVGVLINAINELKAEVDELKGGK